jgi:hypothetical protein
MEIATSTWMMVAFVVALVLSGWKLYPFLVNRTLEDDDTGEDTYKELLYILHKVLEASEEIPNTQRLHKQMTEHSDFDKEKHWRFNENKLHQLLYKLYAQHPHLNSIDDIHKELHVKGD